MAYEYTRPELFPNLQPDLPTFLWVEHTLKRERELEIFVPASPQAQRGRSSKEQS
jgi:hypothetical protein